MRLVKYIASMAIALWAAVTFAQATRISDITISHAWARATVPGMQSGGGYLVISNAGANDRLIAAQASVSEVVELHTMKMEGDMMKMQKVEAIEVPAGKTTELKPGGFHVMFINLKAPLKEGDTIPLRLKFEKAGDVALTMRVEALASSNHSMH